MTFKTLRRLFLNSLCRLKGNSFKTQLKKNQKTLQSSIYYPVPFPRILFKCVQNIGMVTYPCIYSIHFKLSWIAKENQIPNILQSFSTSLHWSFASTLKQREWSEIQPFNYISCCLQKMWPQGNQHCINLKEKHCKKRSILCFIPSVCRGYYIAPDRNQFYLKNEDRKLSQVSESGYLVCCYSCGLRNFNSWKVTLILLKKKIRLWNVIQK